MAGWKSIEGEIKKIPSINKNMNILNVGGFQIKRNRLILGVIWGIFAYIDCPFFTSHVGVSFKILHYPKLTYNKDLATEISGFLQIKNIS